MVWTFVSFRLAPEFTSRVCLSSNELTAGNELQIRKLEKTKELVRSVEYIAYFTVENIIKINR